MQYYGHESQTEKVRERDASDLYTKNSTRAALKRQKMGNISMYKRFTDQVYNLYNKKDHLTHPDAALHDL